MKNRRFIFLGIVAFILFIILINDSSEQEQNEAPSYLQIFAGLAETHQQEKSRKLLKRYKRLLSKKNELKGYSKFFAKNKSNFYSINNFVIAKIQSDIRTIFSQANLEMSLGTTSQHKRLKGYQYIKYFETSIDVPKLTVEDLSKLLKTIESKKPHLFLKSITISQNNARSTNNFLRFRAIVRAYALGTKND